MRAAADARARAASTLSAPRVWAPIALAACLGLGGALPAYAGLFDDEEARKAVLSLRTQADQNQQANDARVKELQGQIEILKRGILDLNNQLEGVRSELAQLRGQGEQGAQGLRDLARDVAEFQRKQKDALAALDERLRRLEPQRLSVDGREAVVDNEEKRAFEDALATLRKGEFGASIQAFNVFVKRHPDSAYVGQSKYWIGSAQYGKGDVKEAAATFKSFLATYADHPRVPDAMLNLANCQAELRDNKAARKTLEDLIKQFPQTEAGKAGRERLSLLK